MKNLEYNSEDARQLLKSVVAAKQDSAEKTLLENNLYKFEILYDLYDEKFESDSLLKIDENICFNNNESIKKALLHLYDSRPRLVAELLDKILYNVSSYKCPNCGLAPTETIDHHLPKSLFPVYAIFPKNLIPCCYRCNLDKRDAWSKCERLFLNPYLDFNKIGKKRFIKAVVDIVAGAPVITCEIINPDGIEDSLMQTIKNHFVTYNLREKFVRFARREVDELERLVKDARRKNMLNAVIEGELEKMAILIEGGDQNDWGIQLRMELYKRVDEIFPEE